jgi:hypothetical protein
LAIILLVHLPVAPTEAINDSIEERSIEKTLEGAGFVKRFNEVFRVVCGLLVALGAPENGAKEVAKDLSKRSLVLALLELTVPGREIAPVVDASTDETIGNARFGRRRALAARRHATTSLHPATALAAAVSPLRCSQSRKSIDD